MIEKKAEETKEMVFFKIARSCEFLIASMLFGFAINEFHFSDYRDPFGWNILLIFIILVRSFIFLRSKNYYRHVTVIARIIKHIQDLEWK